MLLRSGLALLAFFAGSVLSPEEKALIQDISQSGRCATLVDTPDARVNARTLISPGPPPLLSFRFYQGKLHHRFGNAELMLDDAGH